jgi:hypothetical protein
MRKASIGIIVVLLVAIVGYLAMDRHEKDVSNQRNQTFDAQFAK